MNNSQNENIENIDGCISLNPARIPGCYNSISQLESSVWSTNWEKGTYSKILG